MLTLSGALPTGLAAALSSPRGGDLDTSLRKEGTRIAATTHMAVPWGLMVGLSPQAQRPDTPLQGPSAKCRPDTISPQLPTTHGSAHRPPKSPQAASAATGLRGSLDVSSQARHSQIPARTDIHILGEWIRLGVGPPSHAPVPRHFHGHHLRTRKTTKSSRGHLSQSPLRGRLLRGSLATGRPAPLPP